MFGIFTGEEPHLDERTDHRRNEFNGKFREFIRSGRTSREYQYAQQHSPSHEPFQTPQQGGMDIDQIIAVAVRRNRDITWLKGEDPVAVQRVVKTVGAMRDQAANEGQGLSDKQVYLQFRRSVEKAAGEEKDAGTEKSFRILDALMGGPNGEIFFEYER